MESNLSTLQTLLSSNTTPTLSHEIRETINLLEADIEDLETSVRAVESVGDRWGIPEGEKRARRQFVDKVKREVQALRSKIPGSDKGKGKGKVNAQGGGRYTDNPDSAERGPGDDDEDPEEARRWEREEQQLLVRRQDDTLGYISGTLHNLASQAGLIGTEVAVQSE